MAWEERANLRGPEGPPGPPGTPRTVNGVAPVEGSDNILLRPQDIGSAWLSPPGATLPNPTDVYGSGWTAEASHGMRASLISSARASSDPTYNSTYVFDAWWCGDTTAVGGTGFRGWYPVEWDIVGDSTLRSRIQSAANHPNWNQRLRGLDKYTLTVRDPATEDVYALAYSTLTSDYRWSTPGVINLTGPMLSDTWSYITGPQHLNQVQVDGQFAHLYFVISRSASPVADILQLPASLKPATGTIVPIGSAFTSTGGSLLLIINPEGRVYVPGSYWHGSVSSTANLYGFGTWKISKRV